MGNELEAMRQIADAMDGLTPDEAHRVLSWAVDWANEKLEADIASAGGGLVLRQGPPNDARTPHRFERIGDLVDAAVPSTRAEYALVAAYWFQEVVGNENVTGQEVNSELKDLGHGTSDITTAFKTLQNQTPALARQVQKAGTTRQARKRYRLTMEGIRYVQRLLAEHAA